MLRDLRMFVENKVNWLEDFETEGVEKADVAKDAAIKAYQSVLAKMDALEKTEN